MPIAEKCENPQVDLAPPEAVQPDMSVDTPAIVPVTNTESSAVASTDAVTPER